MMKELNLIGIILIAFVIVSCGNTKEVTEKQLLEKDFLADCECVVLPDDRGLDMVEELGEDGVTIVKKVYKWYSGFGKDKEKSVAMMKAEKRAYDIVAYILEDALWLNIPRRTLGPTEVDNAINSYWSDLSKKIFEGYKPYGKAKIEYINSTKDYEATCKVAIEGLILLHMLNEAGSYRPESLQGESLKEFVDINNSIIQWLKVN